MTHKWNVEYTDTFAGEANYCWVKRAVVEMPELTHYGYDGGTNYSAANNVYRRELMRRAKAAVGLTGIRGVTDWIGDWGEFRPYGMATVLLISWGE
jgi:hypothetical protein